MKETMVLMMMMLATYEQATSAVIVMAHIQLYKNIEDRSYIFYLH